jgi:GUN4-like/ARM-like repeat domain, GUN4-N terminal
VSETIISTEINLPETNSDIGNNSQKFLSLKAELKSPSETTQLKAINQLEDYGAIAAPILLDYLSDRLAQRLEAKLLPTLLDGRAYQVIHQIVLEQQEKSQQEKQAEQESVEILDYETRLNTESDRGILPLSSLLQVDLTMLQNLLVQQKFEDADRLTSKLMCQLASKDAAARGWIYFSEIAAIATLDLQTIDQLWTIYSEGKFGFVVQRRIWLSLGKKWEDFWLQIGWKKDGSFTRYPGGFSWNMKAPKGHLPLSNQIRGNKTLESIFNHVAWQ